MERVLTDGAASPDRPTGSRAALELLVHGVGGATPEKMLNDPRTVRITGDDTAAVHRRADDVDAEYGPAGRRDRPVPEAYVWSNLTSGNGTRALWLVLLPFMVVNLAHWMRPATEGRVRLVRVYGLLVRLAALSLTVLLVAAACEVALDLTAWQCAGTRACAARHTWLGFLSPASSRDGWWSLPGRRLALAALVPAALTGLLWFLSHRTWRAYESQEPLARAPEPVDRLSPTALSRPGFWYGRRLVARLRAAHTSAGLLTVAAAVATAAAREDRSPGGPALLDTLGWLLLGGLGGGGLAVLWAVCRRGRSEHRLDRALDRHLVRGLPSAALLLLVLTLVYAGWSRPGWQSADRLPGDVTFGAIALVQGLLVLALAVVARVLHRGSTAPTGTPAPGTTSHQCVPPAPDTDPGRRHPGRLDGPPLDAVPGQAGPAGVETRGAGSPGGRSRSAVPGDETVRRAGTDGAGVQPTGSMDQERQRPRGDEQPRRGTRASEGAAPPTGRTRAADPDAEGGPRIEEAPDAEETPDTDEAPGAEGERDARAVDRAALRGLAGPAVVMLACALGGLMSGGVAQRVGDWLDGTGGSTPGPPVMLTWQASVIPAVLLVLLALTALLGRRAWLLARAERAAVIRDYSLRQGDTARTGAIARARAMATLTDRAPLVVAVTAAATLLLGAGALVGSWLSGRTPIGATEDAYPFVHGAAHIAQALGSWLIGLGFLLFVTWGRRAYKDAAARRTIGILWDVGTFWPRAAHPFAPPCYAERAVPDLTWRMATWTRETGGRLVISGHSQGSVLAAAAAWQLEPGARRRVALLTYGSPIERLYGRWFPAHFGPVALAALHEDVDCWRNLYRLTDPIGGPVRLCGHCGPAVDRPPLRDPLEYGRTGRHPLPAPLLGHSDYQADPAFAEERERLLARLRP